MLWLRKRCPRNDVYISDFVPLRNRFYSFSAQTD